MSFGYIFKEIDPLAPPSNSELITNSMGKVAWKQQQKNLTLDHKLSYVNLFDESEQYIIKIYDNIDEIFNNINVLEVFIDGLRTNLQIFDSNVIMAGTIIILKKPAIWFIKYGDAELQLPSFNEKGIYIQLDTSFSPLLKTISIINHKTRQVYFNWNANKDMPAIEPIKTDPLLSGNIPRFYLKDNVLYCDRKRTQQAQKAFSMYKYIFDTLNFAIVDFTNDANYRPIAVANSIVYYFNAQGELKSATLSTE